MNFARPSVFWIAMLVALVAVIVLLRGVLLPFVAAFVLAYLLDPIANKIDRLGLGRLAATLAIVVPVIIAIVVLLVLTVPIVVRELASFVESLPLYIRRLHALANSSSQPWVSKIIGDGLGEVEHSIGALTAQASEWFDTFLRSIWSGGQALISMLSLVVVTPIIACYLLYHWNTMIAATTGIACGCAYVIEGQPAAVLPSKAIKSRRRICRPRLETLEAHFRLARLFNHPVCDIKRWG
jgi:predicted PurR-regulated permease PerM